MEEAEKEDKRKLLTTLTEGLESLLHPGFSQDNNEIKKETRKTKENKTKSKNNTKVKTRNLLTMFVTETF